MPDETSELAKAVQEVTERAQLLVREEIALAKAEMTDKVAKLVRGVAFLMKRNASRPPSAPSRNRISVVIRKPSHGPLPVPSSSQIPHEKACSR